MCLSTAYRNNKEENKILMTNVSNIEIQGEDIILTDLMEKKLVIKGTLEKVDMMDNFIIIKVK